MITSIIIVFLFLNEFISLLFASERLKIYDSVSGKNKGDLSRKEVRALINLIIRFFIGILYLGFIIYGLFTPLFLYCILTIVISIITALLTYYFSKRGNSLIKRIWVARIDAIITMLIWFWPLLQIIKLIF